MAMTKPNDNQVTHQLNATGSVVRTLKDKLGEVISVKDFGAKGDGVTDDAPAIKSALAYLASIGGGTLKFDNARTYKLSTYTDVGNTDIAINQYGNTSTDKAAIFVNSSNIILDLNGSILLNASGVYGVYFYGTEGAIANDIMPTAAMNSGDSVVSLPSGHGLNANDTIMLLVGAIEYQNGVAPTFYEYAEVLSTTATSATLKSPVAYPYALNDPNGAFRIRKINYIRHVGIMNGVIDGNGGTLSNLQFTNCKMFFVGDITSRNSTNAQSRGIMVDRHSYIGKIEGCFSHDVGGRGFEAYYPASNIKIRDFHALRCGVHGAVLHGRNNEASNLTLVQNGNCGLHLDDVSGARITNVIAIRNAYDGVNIGGGACSDVEITGIDSKHNGQYGISAANATDVRFSGIVDNNKNHGVVFDGCIRPSFKGIATDNAGYGVYVKGASSYPLIEAFIDGNSSFGYGSGDTTNYSIVNLTLGLNNTGQEVFFVEDTTSSGVYTYNGRTYIADISHIPNIYHYRGAQYYTKNATQGQPVGWVCVTSGKPGTFVEMAPATNIDLFTSILTANLPAAGSTMNGKSLIENTGGATRNLIVYIDGARFRIPMTSF